MSEILVHEHGDKWIATFNNRKIAHSHCKNCIVKILLHVTKNSSRYSKIVVLGRDGVIEKTLATGVGQ